MEAKLSAALAAAGCALLSFAPTANANTYTYDLSFDIAPVTITGQITTNCNNCGLTDANVVSWAFNSSSGDSVTSATPGANISFGGDSVLNATPTALNFTISAFGIESFNGPLGTVAVQFNTVNSPCSTSSGCETVFLPFGVTYTAFVSDNQQVGASEASSVPGPIVGAGLPGLMMASLGVLGWWRRKRPGAAALTA